MCFLIASLSSLNLVWPFDGAGPRSGDHGLGVSLSVSVEASATSLSGPPTEGLIWPG